MVPPMRNRPLLAILAAAACGGSPKPETPKPVPPAPEVVIVVEVLV